MIDSSNPVPGIIYFSNMIFYEDFWEKNSMSVFLDDIQN